MTNAAAQLTGMVGPQVYQARFGPTYRTSYIVSIGLLAGAIAAIATTWLIIRKRDQQSEAQSAKGVLATDSKHVVAA